MKVIVCAGVATDKIAQVYENKQDTIEVVKKFETLELCFNDIVDNVVDFDTLFIIDAAIEQTSRSVNEQLNDLLELFDTVYDTQELRIIFRDELIFKNVAEKINSNSRYVAVYNKTIKINDIKNLLLQSDNEPTDQQDEVDSLTEETKELLDKIDSEEEDKKQEPEKKPVTKKKKKPQQPQVIETKESVFDKIKNIPPREDKIMTNGVIVVTGDRGSGVTSTAVNLAEVTSSLGLSTVLIDLDYVHRSINIYYPKFGEEADLNVNVHESLIGALIDPSLYDRYRCVINKTLSVIGLAYTYDLSEGSFNSKK